MNDLNRYLFYVLGAWCLPLVLALGLFTGAAISAWFYAEDISQLQLIFTRLLNEAVAPCEASADPPP